MGDYAKILLEQVEFAYQGQDRLLKGIHLEIKAGEFVCLLGPSGSGKSTLLSLMAGFTFPRCGQVLIDGQPVTGPHPRRITLFQSYGLFPWRQVWANVAYGLELAGMPKAERYRRACALLEQVGLGQWAEAYPRQLSGGMQQRVALARALVVEPEVLFMDEPFGALDAYTRQDMQNLLMELWQKHRPTVVFVTHDLEEACLLADRIVMLQAGGGGIKACVEIGLPRPRRRSDSEFLAQVSKLYHLFKALTDREE